ncbi:MAG: hypothetical protein ACK5L3_04035 [Oscillospiraceae bacterium]
MSMGVAVVIVTVVALLGAGFMAALCQYVKPDGAAAPLPEGEALQAKAGRAAPPPEDAPPQGAGPSAPSAEE